VPQFAVSNTVPLPAGKITTQFHPIPTQFWTNHTKQPTTSNRETILTETQTSNFESNFNKIFIYYDMQIAYMKDVQKLFILYFNTTLGESLTILV